MEAEIEMSKLWYIDSVRPANNVILLYETPLSPLHNRTILREFCVFQLNIKVKNAMLFKNKKV